MLGSKRDRELREELEHHLAQRAADLERGGLAPNAARRQARIEFGGEDKYAEQAREALGGAALAATLQDLRFGLRLLRKSPAFTVVAVLLLAVGIGANAAIFSMVDWLMLRPMAGVADAGQLTYLVATTTAGEHANGFSYPNFSDIRQESGAVFSQVAGMVPFQMDGLAADGATTTFWANYVSGNFFAMLGARPALGRFFQAEPAREADAAPELVLSYDYWKSHFGGRSDVLGKQVAVNGRSTTIVGVAARGFEGVTPILKTEGYLPFTGNLGGEIGGSGDFFHDRGNGSGLMIFARRRPGVELAQTQPALKLVALRLAAQYPKLAPWRTLTAVQLTSAPPGASMGDGNPLAAVAALFLGLAGLVLLLACVNIANLLLARAGMRRREMAVRAALGAGRGRLLRQMLSESLLLSALGGAGGILVALAACRGLNAIPLGSAVPVALSIGVDWRVFLYASALAAVTGLAVGLAPAWQASRIAPQAVLQAGTRGATAAHTRLRAGLVVAEIAGSLCLLIVAGLFARSLGRAQQLDLGFSPNSVVNLSFDPHSAGDDSAQGSQFAASLVAKVESLPGVAAASVAASVPAGSYSYGGGLAIPGRAGEPTQLPSLGYNAVTADYFRTLGIRLLSGRGLRAGETGAAVINAKMAQTYWPRGDAVGQSFTLTDGRAQSVRVVGVVADSATGTLTDPIGPFAYLPFQQFYHSPATLQILARGADAGSLLRAARAQAQMVNPNVPVYDMQTMAEAMHGLNGLFLYELGARLAAIMGLLGLWLALIGVYGVVAYGASQRTHEFGVRMALGAGRGQIFRLVLRQAILMTALGLGLGMGLAALLARALRGMLFGVGALDPLSFLGAAALLAMAALLASLVPARRAVAADPAAALRCE